MTELQATLAHWYEAHRRELPWRSDPTPYYVWLSEIILQQTRVNQGFDYFVRFVEKWPTLNDLASATEEEVLKMWQGLGYYSRARNLHKCARQVVELHSGEFPRDFESLKKLQGIGNYTAAAIASIAFGLPHAVVDGNVYRVLARLYDIDTPINNDAGTKLFAELATTLLDREHPGRHNQAMMEFGALQCVPKNPDCTQCPLLGQCLAFAHQTVDERPKKEKKIKIKTRFFHYLVIKTPDHGVYLHKRKANDIWKNLYDFPCIESEKPLSIEELVRTDYFQKLGINQNFEISRISQQHVHKLTHQTIIAIFVEIKISNFLPTIQINDILLAFENELGTFPVPKLIDNYLNNIN
ncbi:MAG: A/G-specific adenine glycosylase [Bacteroidales bacterium]|nr:A/G-specific adenine glycosylase [Bacteroidales bacterium]